MGGVPVSGLSRVFSLRHWLQHRRAKSHPEAGDEIWRNVQRRDEARHHHAPCRPQA